MYALVAVGFALIFGTTRTFHFAHGATFALAAYVYVGVLNVTKSPIAGIVGALIVSVIFGIFLDRWLYQPMRKKSAASFLTIFVASMGTLYLLDNTIGLVKGTSFFTLNSPLTQVMKGNRLGISPMDVLVWIVAVLTFVSLTLFLNRTSIGRGLRALGDNPSLVTVYGHSVSRLSLWAFALGSALVVPAAVVSVYLMAGSPTMGDSVVNIAVAATIVGGIGRLPGAAVGALILGLAQSLSQIWVQSTWQNAIAFGILLLFLLVRPQGVLSSRGRAA